MIRPNHVVDYDEYYISYNNYDVAVYGDVTTALVIGQMEGFLILNGNHQDGFNEASKDGFAGCLEYFNENIDQANRYSEHVKLMELL